MKNKKIIISIILCVIITFSFSYGDAVAAVFGYSEPTDAWNWSTDGTTYNISGNSSYQTLYTEYYFTNANAYSVNITSATNSGSQMSVKLWKRTTGGKTLIDEFIVPIGGTVSKSYWSSTISYSGIYFLEFSPSAFFSGYISKIY